MATIDWVFLCDYAYVDAAGKASIIGIFENVSSPTLPLQLPQLYVALGLKLAPGDNLQLSATLSSPSGIELSRINPQSVVIPDDAPVMKGVITLGFYQVRFSETGEHHVEILMNGNSVHVIPLCVSIALPVPQS